MLAGHNRALFFPYWGLAYAGYDPAGIKLPPGSKITTYITGFGFYEDQRRIPAVVSMLSIPTARSILHERPTD